MNQDASYFFCGIGGSGMLPLAMIVQARGAVIEGSDRALDQGRTPEKFDWLRAHGVTLYPQDGSGVIRPEQIVVATGAAYPLGLGPVLMKLMEKGAGHWPGISRVMSMPKVRDWFYYRARKATGEQFRALAKPGQTVVVIGDAAKPGKSKEAIASAFEAALLGKL